MEDKEISSSRRSIFLWGNQLAPRQRLLLDRFHTFYGSMLSQDLGSVVPYRDDDFRVDVSPDNDETRRLLIRALARRRSRTVEDALGEFVRHFCAPLMVLCGEAVYEIVYHMNPQGQAVGFELSQITAGSYRRTLRGVLQEIPPEIARERNAPPKVPLSRNELAVFRLATGRRRELGRMVRVFDALQGRHQAIGDLTQGLYESKLPYDFQIHQQSLEDVLARATSCIGWDARWSFRERQLETYEVYRRLRFAKFKAELRSVIIGEINSVLEKVSSRLNVSIAVSIRGLPTEDEVANAFQELMAGSRSNTELLIAFV